MKVFLQHDITGTESKYQLSFDAVSPAFLLRTFNYSGELCAATRWEFAFAFDAKLQILLECYKGDPRLLANTFHSPTTVFRRKAHGKVYLLSSYQRAYTILTYIQSLSRTQQQKIEHSN